MAETAKQPEAQRLSSDNDFLTKIIVGIYGEGTAERFLNFQEVDDAQWQKDKNEWIFLLEWPQFREKAQKFIDTAPRESRLRQNLVALLPTVRESYFEKGFSIWDIFLELFPDDASKRIGPDLEAWRKKIEEALKSDTAFENKIRKYLDDPRLADKQVIREWLKARINAAVLTSVGSGRTERVGLLQTLTASQTPPAGPGGIPIANDKPLQSPPTQPGNAPSGQPGQTTAQPPQPTGPTAEPTAAPAAGAPPKETAAEFQTKLQKEASSSGMFELLGKAMASLAGMLENFKNWDPMKSLGLGGKTAEPEKKSTGVKFTEEELKKIALDLAKNKDKVYPSQDKAVEYVTTALNLPLRETPQIFLDSLTDSGMIFDKSMDNMTNLEPGDVLFFKKANEKNEDFAYTCAVITINEPLTMKMVPDGGGAPKDFLVKESDYFKNSWYGFVKTKQNAPETQP